MICYVEDLLYKSLTIPSSRYSGILEIYRHGEIATLKFVPIIDVLTAMRFIEVLLYVASRFSEFLVEGISNNS